MKKTRIFMVFLMIVTLLAFTACAKDNGTDMGPADNGTNGATDGGIIDRGINDVENGVRDGVNDLDGNGVTNNDNVNTSGSGMNNLNNTAY